VRRGLGPGWRQPRLLATACSCCDTMSAAVACLRDEATATWMVAMVAARLDGATPVVAEAMLKSVAGIVAMRKT
jgi:hypothetical protein